MLDEVNVTQGQEELLKMTRGDYFTFITREDELYAGGPNVAMIDLQSDCSVPKLSSSLDVSVDILPHFTIDAGNLA